jgi:hypothetical protein
VSHVNEWAASHAAGDPCVTCCLVKSKLALAMPLALWVLPLACGSRTGFLQDTGTSLGGSSSGGGSGSSGGSGSGGSSGGSSGSSSSSSSGSSSGSGTIQDASMPDASCSLALLRQLEQRLVLPGGGYLFARISDFLDFFRVQAVNDDVALCNGATTVQWCPYDPTIPQTGPSDVHHSNVLNEFVGPDGDPYAWVYFQDVNEVVAGDATRSAGAYALVVEYVTCSLELHPGMGQ